MVKFLDVITVKKTHEDGTIEGALSLQVSTIAELPHIGGTVDNYIVAEGSIAEVIQEGVWPTLDDDDKWYADGSEVG